MGGATAAPRCGVTGAPPRRRVGTAVERRCCHRPPSRNPHAAAGVCVPPSRFLVTQHADDAGRSPATAICLSATADG